MRRISRAPGSRPVRDFPGLCHRVHLRTAGNVRFQIPAVACFELYFLRFFAQHFSIPSGVPPAVFCASLRVFCSDHPSGPVLSGNSKQRLLFRKRRQFYPVYPGPGGVCFFISCHYGASHGLSGFPQLHLPGNALFHHPPFPEILSDSVCGIRPLPASVLSRQTVLGCHRPDRAGHGRHGIQYPSSPFPHPDHGRSCERCRRPVPLSRNRLVCIYAVPGLPAGGGPGLHHFPALPQGRTLFPAALPAAALLRHPGIFQYGFHRGKRRALFRLCHRLCHGAGAAAGTPGTDQGQGFCAAFPVTAAGSHFAAQ